MEDPALWVGENTAELIFTAILVRSALPADAHGGRGLCEQILVVSMMSESLSDARAAAISVVVIVPLAAAACLLLRQRFRQMGWRGFFWQLWQRHGSRRAKSTFTAGSMSASAVTSDPPSQLRVSTPLRECLTTDSHSLNEQGTSSRPALPSWSGADASGGDRRTSMLMSKDASAAAAVEMDELAQPSGAGLGTAVSVPRAIADSDRPTNVDATQQ